MYSLVRLLLACKELYTGHLCSGQSASLEGNPIPDKGLGLWLSIEQAWQWGSAVTPGIIPAPAVPVTCSGPEYFYP